MIVGIELAHDRIERRKPIARTKDRAMIVFSIVDDRLPSSLLRTMMNESIVDDRSKV